MADQEDYDDAENWQAKYDNMLADIWNSKTGWERESKINYYDKQGALAQFRDSGLDVDNDLGFIREQQGGEANPTTPSGSVPWENAASSEAAKPEFQKVEEQAQSQQNNEDWYNTTANQVEADHPDWSTEELTDYMTNLVNGGSPEAYAKQIDNPVGAWQDKYNNMLADIANSSTKSDQQDKIDYYRSSGILRQFKESGFDTDNDISYITNTQNLSNPAVSSIPAVNNVVNAARDYVGTAKEDISKLREANDAAAEQRATKGFTDPNAAPMIEGDIGEPSIVTGAGETAAQKEALSQTYRDVVGKPAGYVAVTPYVPAPIRSVAGALYTPNLVHDVAETYKEASAPSAALSADDWIKAGKPTDKLPSTTGGKTPTTAEAVGKTIQEAVINPVITPIKEAVTEPGKFVGAIVNDPTKLWSNVFLPAAVVGRPVRAAVNKVADTALDKVYQAPEEVVNRQAENINAGTDQISVEQAPVEQAPAVLDIPLEESAIAKEAIAKTTPVVPAKNAANDIVKAEESKADHHPAEPEKALWQMDNEEYDTARLNKLVPDYTVSFTAPHKAGVEAGANPETKTVYRERGIDSDDSFSHELRHVIVDNYLPQWYKIHSPGLEKSVQSYLGTYRPHDATHPEASWGESAQALVDDYFKSPDRLKENLPGIYSYFKRNKLDQFKDVDVSHRAIVAEALKEGKPVPEEVLQEYPDLERGGNKNEEIERPTNEYPDNRDAENAESSSQVTPEVPARSEGATSTKGTENANVAQGQEKPFVPPVGEEAPPQLDPNLSVALSKGLLASGPQLEKFRAAREQTAAAIRSPRELFSPSSVSPAAKLSAGSLRELLAKNQRGQDVLTQALENDRDHFERLPEKDRLDFINKVETGDTEGLNAYEAGVAKKLQAVLKDRVSKVRMLGKGKLKNLIDNYLPHIWKNPQEAAKDFSTWDKSRARRPLEGSKNFLKQRHIPTTKEGMQWRVYDKDDTLIGSFDDPIKANFLAASLKGRVGKPLVPITTNPIDLTLMKIREMDKYIMANHFTREVEDMGLGKWATHAPEPDWKAVNTLQRSYPIKDKEGKEHVITSRFYAMPDAARIANNYLSPGLRGSPIYNGLRVAGNAMNQYQLGMSAFHLGFVTVDTMLSQLALAQKQALTAANQLIHGKFKKAASSAGSSALNTLTLPVSMPHTLWRGNKMLKEWYHPESGDTKVADVMDALVAGGSRARMDEFYQAGERRFGQELQQQYYNITNGGKGKALGWAVKQILPWNFVRLIPRIVMEEVVPRAKLGVAANMMQYEMAKNPFMDRTELRATARKVWDSTDNRLGQMVYDNLFWNKVLKDALMVSVRSVGWNVGTVREVGGGLVDLAKMPADLLRGKKVDFTHRTSYAAALTMGTVVMGAMITRLATGTNPKDYRDYFFPRIGGTDEYGNPLRVSLPSYAKDVYSLWQKSQRKGLGHAVSETVLTKTHPFWQTLAELYNNKDYFGKQIYTPTQEDYASKEFVNNLPGQVKQIGKFIAGQFVPFSMQSLQKLKEDEGTMLPNPKPTNIAEVPRYVGREYYNRFVPTTTRQILPMVGVTPAPRDINQTAAEQKAFDLRMEKKGNGARTTADSTSKAETQIRKQLQSGDTSLLLSSLQNGTITKGQYSSLKALKGLNPLQQSLKSASVEDTLSVYKVATPEEQESLKGLLIDKFNRKIKNGTPEDRVKYHQMRQDMFGY